MAPPRKIAKAGLQVRDAECDISPRLARLWTTPRWEGESAGSKRSGATPPRAHKPVPSRIRSTAARWERPGWQMAIMAPTIAPVARWVDLSGISTPWREWVATVAVTSGNLAVPVVDDKLGMLPLRQLPRPLDGLDLSW